MKCVFLLLLLLSMVSFYWSFECNSQKCCVDICVKWEECRNSIILNSEMNIWERTDQNVRGEERKGMITTNIRGSLFWEEVIND